MSKIIVKAKAERGFYRAGIHFTREGVELDTSKLKKGALEAIENESNLIVVKPAESDADRKKREKAEADAAAAQEKVNDAAAAQEKVNDAAAVEREKAALVVDEKAWRVAEEKAKAASGFDAKVWAKLADADRVGRIEAVVSGEPQA